MPVTKRRLLITVQWLLGASHNQIAQRQGCQRQNIQEVIRVVLRSYDKPRDELRIRPPGDTTSKLDRLSEENVSIIQETFMDHYDRIKDLTPTVAARTILNIIHQERTDDGERGFTPPSDLTQEQMDELDRLREQILQPEHSISDILAGKVKWRKP